MFSAASFRLDRSAAGTAILVGAVATVYFLAARLGLLLAFHYKNVSPVWPPSGVAVASLYFFGLRVWPGVLLGAFFANFSTNLAAPTAAVIAIGNTLEGVSAAALLRRSRSFEPALGRVRNVALVVSAALASPTLAATMGVASLSRAGFVHADAFGQAWLTWWIGDGMGILVVGSAILIWATRESPSDAPGIQGIWRGLEALGIAAATVLASLFAFGPGNHVRYSVWPAVVLAALRFGQRGASAAIVAVSGIAVWSTIHGTGPFMRADPALSLMDLQTWIGVLTVTMLFLGAAVVERRRAAHALWQAESRFRLALEHSDITVYSQDRDLRYTWIYDGKNRFPLERVLGKTDADLAPAEDAERLTEVKRRVLQTGVGERCEISATTHGKTSTYDLLVEPVRGAGGEVVGVSGVANDITHIKEYQAAIEALNERLRRSVRETHHRVKNNLQVIAAMVDMRLMDGLEQIPVQEVRRLATHTRTLAAVHDLLTHEAKGEGDTQTLSAKAMIEKLVPMLRTVSLDRPVTLDAEDTALSPSLASSLAIIVSELVGNAIKHGKGEVRILLRNVNGCVRLEVMDHGEGFSAGFDPEAASGTGLELVENLSRWDLGGEMECGNRPPAGACVSITFCPTAEGERREPPRLRQQSPAGA